MYISISCILFGFVWTVWTRLDCLFCGDDVIFFHFGLFGRFGQVFWTVWTAVQKIDVLYYQQIST